MALVWKQLDTSVPWVHRLSRRMHAGDVYKPGLRPVVGPEFEGLQSHVAGWEDSLSTADIMELTKSRSYYLSAGEATRSKVLANLDWYLHTHLGHAVKEDISLPYLTLTWRAAKA